MIHPTIPCHKDLKPLFKKVLSKIEARICLVHYPQYGTDDDYKSPSFICDVLGEIGGKHELTAREFVSNSIEGKFSFNDWLTKHDSVFAAIPKDDTDGLIKYSDLARISWLQWLIAN